MSVETPMSLTEIWSQVHWGECNATFWIICRAKIINYALLYGKTVGLHAGQGHRRDAAGGADVQRRVLSGLRGVRALIDKTLEDARASGFVQTMFGRRRPVWRPSGQSEAQTQT